MPALHTQSSIDRVFCLARHHPTPFLALTPNVAGRNVAALTAALPGVEVYYAVKCNAHPALVDAVRAAGAGFEVASSAEVEQLIGAGVHADQMLCLHPIKSPAFLEVLAKAGVDWLAVDAAEEVDKVAMHAPGRRVLVRVDVSNTGSRHPLRGKFGCPAADAVSLLRRAADRGLRPAGVTTHVGSQCESLATWRAALDVLGEVCRGAAAAGLPVELVSLGGGIPVTYTRPVISAEEIGRVIARARPDRFAPGGCRVTIEPGRAIAAAAGTLVASVIGLASRGNEPTWAYLDAGIYHGLLEALPASGGFSHPIHAEGPPRPYRQYRLGGPTCDGMDVLPHIVELPELRIGDRLAFRMAGAYSAELSSPFNGFPVPPTVIEDGTGDIDCSFAPTVSTAPLTIPGHA